MKRIFTFIMFLLFGMAATLMAASEIPSIYPANAISVVDGVTVDLFDVSVPGVAVTGTAEYSPEQYAFESNSRISNLGTGAGTMVAPGAIVRNRGSGLWHNTNPTWPRYLLTDSNKMMTIDYTGLPGNLLAGSTSTRD